MLNSKEYLKLNVRKQTAKSKDCTLVTKSDDIKLINMCDNIMKIDLLKRIREAAVDKRKQSDVSW